jgi:hypothetical protein
MCRRRHVDLRHDRVCDTGCRDHDEGSLASGRTSNACANRLTSWQQVGVLRLQQILVTLRML